MDMGDSSAIDQMLLFNELFMDEVIYVVDQDFKIVFASKGAKDFYQTINKAKDDLTGKLCYEAFKLKTSQCDQCRANFLNISKNKQLVTESEYPNIKIAYKWAQSKNPVIL